jgi:hypothetical protein
VDEGFDVCGVAMLRKDDALSVFSFAACRHANGASTCRLTSWPPYNAQPALNVLQINKSEKEVLVASEEDEVTMNIRERSACGVRGRSSDQEYEGRTCGSSLMWPSALGNEE